MKKNAVRGAALLLAAVLLWYAWPRPLERAFDAERPMKIQVVKMGIRDGELYMDTDEAYSLEGGSEALEQVLRNYSYHICLSTLVGADDIDNKGGTGENVQLWNADGQMLMNSGTKHVYVNDRVYQVGWFGNRKGAELNRDILAALRNET